VFEKRVAIVTGGTRGIGAAITSDLAKRGCHVAAGYSKDRAKADEMKAGLPTESISLHQGRVDDPDSCNRVVQEVLKEFGRVDYLVNNAGITIDKAVLDHMLERGSGRIVNISSVIGETGNIGQANYAASKSGLFGLTKSLALETARKGITVNCVAPGFIETEMVGAIPKAALDMVIEKIPLRRLGRPEEVARVVRFLLEDEAGYVTGAVYTVNGGLEM
jgi:NAD(P)-dependent dehydrogenase (short-subunit alcohol dehydrogenase family)